MHAFHAWRRLKRAVHIKNIGTSLCRNRQVAGRKPACKNDPEATSLQFSDKGPVGQTPCAATTPTVASIDQNGVSHIPFMRMQPPNLQSAHFQRFNITIVIRTVQLHDIKRNLVGPM